MLELEYVDQKLIENFSPRSNLMSKDIDVNYITRKTLFSIRFNGGYHHRSIQKEPIYSLVASSFQDCYNLQYLETKISFSEINNIQGNQEAKHILKL
ncbi:hypothetical protein [Peribacillus sp. TH14]|uniref:hypothetical protein n=1 Tax=Peribacillus sp. TH14 TaxID=2798481 RepID=UPI001A920464|nr:hypothetical protein [Peribacillus sp. TH14]